MFNITLLSTNIKKLLVIEMIIFLILSLLSKCALAKITFALFAAWCACLLFSKTLRTKIMKIACDMKKDDESESDFFN